MMNILFTGDTFLKTRRVEVEPFTQSIAELYNRSGNVCINLETTVGEGGKKAPKAYNFQTLPSMLKYAKSLGVSIASVANNHSLDYMREGFDKTLNNLHKQNLNVIGATAENYYQLRENDITCCISSYYGNGEDIAPFNIDNILEDIRKHKKDNDFLVVCLHWGEEYVPYPSPKQQSIARRIIDEGASVVIGHHPHVMQGYEEYHGGLIFYSLGNFNFFVDHPWAKKMVETTKAYCVSLNFEKSHNPEFSIVPIDINGDWQPSVITVQKDKDRFFEYLNDISKPLSKKIGNLYYGIQASPHYFHNHLPSWRKRFKNYGTSQIVPFLKWSISPYTCIYSACYIVSLFVKRPKY